MKTILISLSIFLILSLSFCFGQNYSYSFTGKVDTLFLNELAIDISKVEGVKEVKWRFKEEKEAGEFIIFTSNYANKSNPFPFEPADVKELMLSNRLTPLKLIELPN